MIITYKTADCASCGGRQSYGNCLIGNNHLVRGCARCGAEKTVRLPTIKKKILYLDQCFLSSMFRGDDSRIEPLARKIKQLIHQQQLVTPFSNVHETESLQWGDCQNKELFQFIKRHAVGHAFTHWLGVWSAQLSRAFQAYLTSADNPVVTEADAVPAAIHRWDGYEWVDIRRSLEDPAATARCKADFAKRLTEDFAKWRGRNLSYQELHAEVASELSAEIKNLIPWTISQMIFSAKRLVGEDKARQAVDAFLISTAFHFVPFIDIASALYAKLRQKIQNPTLYTNQEEALDKFNSLAFDVRFISTYAPYCDAMFIDKTMCQWLNENDVQFAKKYKTRLFPYSKAGLADLSQWLENIENSISADLKQTIRLAYPSASV